MRSTPWGGERCISGVDAKSSSRQTVRNRERKREGKTPLYRAPCRAEQCVRRDSRRGELPGIASPRRDFPGDRFELAEAARCKFGNAR